MSIIDIDFFFGGGAHMDNAAMAAVGSETNPLSITESKDITWLRKPVSCRRLEAVRVQGERIPTEFSYFPCSSPDICVGHPQ